MHVFKTLLITALIASTSVLAQPTSMKLDRPARTNDHYRLHSVLRDSMYQTMTDPKSGELFNMTAKYRTVTLDAQVLCKLANLKGKEVINSYRIISCVQENHQLIEGIGSEPEVHTTDTLIAPNAEVVVEFSPSGKQIKINGQAVTDSVMELLKDVFDDSGNVDADSYAQWKKARKVGERWKVDTKELVRQMQESSESAKGMRCDSAAISFDSLVTIDKNRCAAFSVHMYIPLESVPFPEEFSRAFSPTSSSVRLVMGATTPLDTKKRESVRSSLMNMQMSGLFKYGNGAPDMTLTSCVVRTQRHVFSF